MRLQSKSSESPKVSASLRRCLLRRAAKGAHKRCRRPRECCREYQRKNQEDNRRNTHHAAESRSHCRDRSFCGIESKKCRPSGKRTQRRGERSLRIARDERVNRSDERHGPPTPAKRRDSKCFCKQHGLDESRHHQWG